MTPDEQETDARRPDPLDRYVSYESEAVGTVICDRNNNTAWIASTLTHARKDHR